MARTIEARVIQKVATEAEWLSVTLPLYNGEIALVRSGDRVVNMKVGNGTSKFSELNYVYNGGFNGSINPSTSTSALTTGFYFAEISGTYTNAGNIVVKEGYYTVLEKTSTGWKKSTEVKMPIQDLTPLENRTTALENKNGGEVSIGENKNVTGGKVFDYINHKSITKYDPLQFPDGYKKDMLVIDSKKIYSSLIDNNKERPSLSSNWVEIKFSSEVDQEFDIESTNSIANKRVTKRTSLLERLEDEATEIIVNEYTETKYSGFTEFHAEFSSNLSGAGYIDHNNIYKKDDTTRRAYKDILIPENTFKIEIKNIASSTGSANPTYCCFGLKKSNGSFDVIIDGVISSSTTREEASVELIKNSYTHLSLTVYNNDSLFTISFFNAEGEIIEKIDKNYLYNKLNNETSSSYANPIGKIKDVSNIGLPSGYNTLYYPFIISTEKIVNPKGKYYMYFSTDHDTDTNGKIGMFYSDDLIDWTFHGNIITSSSFGGLKQPETPCVVWSDDLKKYLMYFHVSSDYSGVGYSQTTLIAESVDGLSFSYAKPAFNIPMSRMKGNGHNGYFSCQKINGIYKGVSLFGGGDIDFRAIHFSKDGLNWITHQKEANTVAPSNYFFRQNSLCRISLSDVVSESGAGGVAGSYKTFSMAYCTDDMEVIGSEIIGNILPSGEGQVVSSISTSVINGEVYILCVYSKTKIVIKKIV